MNGGATRFRNLRGRVVRLERIGLRLVRRLEEIEFWVAWNYYRNDLFHTKQYVYEKDNLNNGGHLDDGSYRECTNRQYTSFT